jgi:hypothetical protein
MKGWLVFGRDADQARLVDESIIAELDPHTGPAAILVW